MYLITLVVYVLCVYVHVCMYVFVCVCVCVCMSGDDGVTLCGCSSYPNEEIT